CTSGRTDQPLDGGTALLWPQGQSPRQPRSIAAPACRAVRVPRNLSGHTRTRMAATVQSAPNRAGRPTRQVTISREDLVGIAHAERQRLGRMIQFAEPDSWDEPSAASGWWNRDVMAH